MEGRINRKQLVEAMSPRSGGLVDAVMKLAKERGITLNEFARINVIHGDVIFVKAALTAAGSSISEYEKCRVMASVHGTFAGIQENSPKGDAELARYHREQERFFRQAIEQYFVESSTL